MAKPRSYSRTDSFKCPNSFSSSTLDLGPSKWVHSPQNDSGKGNAYPPVVCLGRLKVILIPCHCLLCIMSCKWEQAVQTRSSSFHSWEWPRPLGRPRRASIHADPRPQGWSQCQPSPALGLQRDTDALSASPMWKTSLSSLSSQIRIGNLLKKFLLMKLRKET